jgi:hypothetical protein
MFPFSPNTLGDLYHKAAERTSFSSGNVGKGTHVKALYVLFKKSIEVYTLAG